MLALYRTHELLHNERKWLKALLDTRLGLSLDVDVVFTSVASEALQRDVVLVLGGTSRSVITNSAPQSDISSRGLVEDYAGHFLVTTWNLPEAMKDPACSRELLVDAFKARIYAYGLGNKNTGYLSTVKMAGGEGSSDLFSVEQFETVVSAFEAAMGA